MVEPPCSLTFFCVKSLKYPSSKSPSALLPWHLTWSIVMQAPDFDGRTVSDDVISASSYSSTDVATNAASDWVLKRLECFSLLLELMALLRRSKT
ncbi:hypothetical protein ZIOFF_062380 [Zingiber officinale]|uniref:Uncharacterized protein n=1 Tax=Zingiber officinale TaxID=94328 RepID=A0A8J5KEI7_ZINOF|nr:hypothetical protein ZIOFF_062380 [Zingiber officinale]